MEKLHLVHNQGLLPPMVRITTLLQVQLACLALLLLVIQDPRCFDHGKHLLFVHVVPSFLFCHTVDDSHRVLNSRRSCVPIA